MIATTMLPSGVKIRVIRSKNTSTMNSAWKIGVNSHGQEVDRVRAGRGRLERGLAGDRRAVGRRLPTFVPGMQAATTRAMPTRNRIGASRASNGEKRVTRWFSILQRTGS